MGLFEKSRDLERPLKRVLEPQTKPEKNDVLTTSFFFFRTTTGRPCRVESIRFPQTHRNKGGLPKSHF